jgi:DNA repair protein RadC
MREILTRMMKKKILHKHIRSSWNSLIEYLRVTMGESKTEQFKILFLNKKNILIADELQTAGTVDQTPVYPREVIKRALFHEASAIIIVHNHPSGNPSPSQSDIMLTNAIAGACKAVNVTLHDHVIITDGDYYSFKSNLLI